MCHCHFEPQPANSNSLDIAFKFATIFIAIFNAYFAVQIFNFKNKKEDIDKEKDRRIQWFKTLVLDHTLDALYDVFSNMEKELLKLKQIDFTDKFNKDKIKGGVINTLDDNFITLRRTFIDMLLAIDKSLYDEILKSSDDLQTYLSEKIADDQMNFADEGEFENIIFEKLTETKTNMISRLFSYRG